MAAQMVVAMLLVKFLTLHLDNQRLRKEIMETYVDNFKGLNHKPNILPSRIKTKIQSHTKPQPTYHIPPIISPILLPRPITVPLR